MPVQLIGLAASLTHPWLAVVPAVLAAAVLCPAGWWLARELHGSRVLAAVSGAALAGSVAITLARPGLTTTVLSVRPNVHSVTACAVSDPWDLTPEGLLNVVLLVPFALLAGLAIGRPWLVTAIALLASAGIETIQALYAVGICDTSDLVHNGAGAAAAALLVAAARHASAPARVAVRSQRSGGTYGEGVHGSGAGTDGRGCRVGHGGSWSSLS